MSQEGSEYRLELEASFLFTIETTIEGLPRLERAQLEELIDENWRCISADADVLLESHWELISFSERPSQKEG
jgi:hypothetical protein